MDESSNKTVDQQHKNIDVERTRQQQIVPILKQDYSVSKETNSSEVKIEKRLVTKTKTVKVPVVYEELYINDKKLRSVEEFRIISALKDKINSISSRDDPGVIVEQSVKKKNKIENRGELVPLLSSSDEGDSETQGEKERTIPLYEDQLEINKKMVKVAEIVITKRRVTEKKKINLDVITEEVTVKYPDGRSEKLS